MPSDGNTRPVRARDRSYLSRSSPFHNDTGDARLKDAVFPRGLPSNAGGVVYAVWWREALLYGVNASGCWTPQRGLFDTMYAVYLTDTVGHPLVGDESASQTSSLLWTG